MSKRLFIYHYNPIELYPPVVNFLNYSAETLEPEWQVVIFTSYPPDSVEQYISPSPRTKIIRRGKAFAKGKKWQNASSLVWFNISGILNLIAFRVNSVLYFETSSALPSIFGKLIWKKQFRLFIHYHEYMDRKDYARTRFQSFIHSREMHLYTNAAWISHTNPKRMEMFLNDINSPELSNCKIMPNFPPIGWSKYCSGEKRSLDVVRFVFVGAISEHTSYLREFLTWLSNLNFKYTFDIYTQSETEKLGEIIKECRAKHITIRGYVKNSDLPKILSSYHVGLILYKGIELNVIYSAPNKLFEYLACGLDVWVDNSIEGVIPYYTSGVFPKVVPISFKNLPDYEVENLINREGLTFKPFSESYEKEYKRLVDGIMAQV